MIIKNAAIIFDLLTKKIIKIYYIRNNLVFLMDKER